MHTKSQLAEKFRDKEYRDAFVAAQLRIGLPMQCRALRESRKMTQPTLAEAAHMSQPRISEIERPGERKLNLETLLRLASAFDVALQVRFVPFSQLVDDDDALHFDSFYVPPYEQDIENLEKREEGMKLVMPFPAALYGSNENKDQSGLSMLGDKGAEQRKKAVGSSTDTAKTGGLTDAA